MESKEKGLIIGLIVLIIALGSIAFLLTEQRYSEIKEATTPWAGCLEIFEILREFGYGTYEIGRANEYQFQVLGEFGKQNCEYYVFRWMPEHYPERSYVEKAWYHEFRLDLTEEQKQKLRDAGHWPD